MTQAIPVFAFSRLSPPVTLGELSAEISWVKPDGSLAKVAEVVAVQNGVATYHGPPLPLGLQFAIRITSSAHGIVFRSGPLRRLPGPPSQVVATNGAIMLYVTSFGFSLSNFGSDGVPEVLVQNLQNLPPPLEYSGLQLGVDWQGHYSVTVNGHLRVAFLRMSFSYTRLFQLLPSVDPGRPTPVVLAQPSGSPRMSGLAIAPYQGVLDALMKHAVEQQLNVALLGLANLDLSLSGLGTSGVINLISVNDLQLSSGGPLDLVSANVGGLGGGWITGLNEVVQSGHQAQLA
jgi:hypothetical protein